MPSQKVLEQHIALFGESGSGKTVMLSSFYGSEQEPENIRPGAYNVLAEDAGQGIHLHQNYLGMKKSQVVPDQDKYSAKAYRFLLKLKGSAEASSPLKDKPFGALRLIWHDYPGEWFEQDVSGPEEARRRVETFRALLDSHVALLLVDGQKLLDNAGQEESYLKSLFSNFSNSLLLLQEDLLAEDGPMVTFPRIWMIALSKADLLPDLDVQTFKELVIEKAGGNVRGLRSILGGLVQSESALSVGEDFILISSAKFTADSIQVADRIGLDLILPVASVLPLERHVRWAEAGKLSRKVATGIVENAALMAAGLGVATKLASVFVGKKNKFAVAIGVALTQLGPHLENAIKEVEEKLRDADREAMSKRDNLAAILHGFREALDHAERDRVLIRGVG